MEVRGSPDRWRSPEEPAHCHAACKYDSGNTRKCVGATIVMPLEFFKSNCENPELERKQQEADHERSSHQPYFTGGRNGASGLFANARGMASMRRCHGSTPIAYSFSPFA